MRAELGGLDVHFAAGQVEPTGGGCKTVRRASARKASSAAAPAAGSVIALVRAGRSKMVGVPAGLALTGVTGGS